MNIYQDTCIKQCVLETMSLETQLEFYQKIKKSCDDKINDIKKVIETENIKQDAIIVAKLLKSIELLKMAENLIVTEYFVNIQSIESEDIIDDILTKIIKINFNNKFELTSKFKGTINGCGKISYIINNIELSSREDCEWTTFTQNDLKCIKKCYETSHNINEITLGQFKKFLSQIFAILRKY
jgi:hypothetical protein